MTKTPAQRTRDKWQRDPVYYVESVLKAKLDPKQIEVIESVRDNPRTDFKAANGIGKTFLAGCVAHWFIDAFGPRCSVIATSSTDRQLWRQLWPEIENLYNRAGGVDVKGGRLLEKYYRPAPNIAKWFLLGFATEKEENFEGFHNENILVIFDESKGIKDPIWRGAERCLRGTSGTRRFLASGTPPLAPVGEFVQISLDPNKAKRWKHYQLSAWDSPRLSDAENQEMLDTYGEDHPFYQSMVLGQVPTSSLDTLININDVQNAAEREIEPGTPIVFGIDVSGRGIDETVMTKAEGLKFTQYIYPGKDDALKIATRYKELVKDLPDPKKIPVKIEDIGGGAEACSLLESDGYNVIRVNVSQAAKDSEHYYDIVTETFVELGKIFKNEEIDIPDDPILKAQLYQRTQTEPKRKGGRLVLKVKSKDEMRTKKTGATTHSPDRADSLMLAVCEPKKKSTFQFSC